MKNVKTSLVVVLATACSCAAAAALAVTLGQIDTFEDGTTANWIVGAGGQLHPAPPQNIPDGGPAGPDDNYLLLTALGNNGPGSRLSVLNLTQWGGDYLGAGIGGIGMDVANFGITELHLRLLLADPTVGPPVNIAITGAVVVPAGSGWQPVAFSVALADLIVLEGDVTTLLGATTELRIFHNPDPTFPPPPIAAQLGVDNITALTDAVSVEAATWGAVKAIFR